MLEKRFAKSWIRRLANLGKISILLLERKFKITRAKALEIDETLYSGEYFEEWQNEIYKQKLRKIFSVMSKIVACQPRPHYHVWIRFEDGLEGEVNLSHLVGQGVFKELEYIPFFNRVSVNPVTHTLQWEKDIDLDPYLLREQIGPPRKI